jgi:hypothetical protein
MIGAGNTQMARVAVGYPLVSRRHVDLGRCATALCCG